MPKPRETSSGSTPSPPRETATGTRAGAWLNKRALAFVELPFRHELTPMGDGWRVVAIAAGRMTIHFTDGVKQRYDLAEGDTLSATGEELYLVLAGGSPAGDGKDRKDS
jgi:hypothetical protein